MTLKFRGVRETLSVGHLRPELLKVLDLASVWSARNGVDVYVRSLNDHQHSPNSLHYEDLAVDLCTEHEIKVGRPRHTASSQLKDLFKFLMYGLSVNGMNGGYDVIHGDAGHKTHIHVEYDVRQRKKEEEIRADD